MALVAMCIPILPGKKAAWQQMADRFSAEPMKSKMKASREAAGVHERTFLQETPNGDFVVVTLEGQDPLAAFGRMMADPSMSDFLKWAADVHGMRPDQAPPAPRLIFDSRA